MGTEQIRRWESGALAHAVTDPFGQGPLPWLRGSENYFDDTGQVVPWYVDHAARPSGDPRRARAPASTAAPAPPTTCTARSRASPPPARWPPARPSTSTSPSTRPSSSASTSTASATTAATAPPRSPPAPGCPASSSRPRSPPTAPSPATTGGCPGGCRSRRTGTSARMSPCSPPPTATAPTSPSPSATTSPADLLLLLPDITWQAYNLYPEDGRTGASLYHAWDEEGRLLGEADAADTVSFDRPYAGAGLPAPRRPRLRLHPLGRALRLRPRLRRRPRSARRPRRPDPLPRPGLPRPRRVLVGAHAPHRRSAPATAAPRSSSSPPTPCTGRSSWPRPRPARRTGCCTCRKRQRPRAGPRSGARSAEPEQQLLGIQYAGRVPEPHPLVVRNARPLAVGRHRGRTRATRSTAWSRARPTATSRAPRSPSTSDRILLAHSPYQDSEGAPPPPGDVPLPGAVSGALSSPPARSPGPRPWTAPAMSTRGSSAPPPTSSTASANATDQPRPDRVRRRRRPAGPARHNSSPYAGESGALVHHPRGGSVSGFVEKPEPVAGARAWSTCTPARCATCTGTRRATS